MNTLSISVGGQDLGFSSSAFGGTTIVDSGSTLTAFPQSIYNSIVNALKNSAMNGEFYLTLAYTNTTALTCQSSQTPAYVMNENYPKLNLTLMGSDGQPFSIIMNATQSYLFPVTQGEWTYW